ncbi:Alpha/beta hydrolase family protein [Planctomycetes bacterium Pla163]|uniref:Alpha/beta hydrolase family protein n=1 Tax=Rohdeia mirabilis TaxID=2528008 RepID=A0A518CVP1_9BACT|nr:Alpha/beta hydrolase family protein [Planctomycetes bacterium Pla163]
MHRRLSRSFAADCAPRAVQRDSYARPVARLAALCVLATLVACDHSRPGQEPAAPDTVIERVEHDGQLLAVHVREASESRACIVLVHGMTWSAVPDFDLAVEGEELSFMEGLVARGVNCYALDLRGYGATARDADGFNDPDEASADLLAVVDWVTEREGCRPTVMGWSLGSWVAQLAAQRAPEPMAGLVLYGWPGDERDFEAFPTADDPQRIPTTAEDARSDFITPDAISERAIAGFVRAALATDPVRMDWSDWSTFEELDAARVTVPTLVLRGALDPIAESRPAVELFIGLEQDQLTEVVVPGCDHAAHLERGRSECLDAVAAHAITWSRPAKPQARPGRRIVR